MEGRHWNQWEKPKVCKWKKCARRRRGVEQYEDQEVSDDGGGDEEIYRKK